jgi:peptidoglycan L-alanyl-D-glutamate endopeptidase CwlK
MSLRAKQSVFMHNLGKLIIFAYENGMELTAGELLRTSDQQKLYFEGYSLIKTGGVLKLAKTSSKSKTMFSKHLKKLAVDLNLFIDGQYKTDKESFKPLAEYWKSLHPKNVSGYDWGWDFNHFQMSE